MPLARLDQLKPTLHAGAPSRASRSLTSCISKLQIRDPILNIGVGAGALYMLITCQEEMKKLNKTVEETENLVQELKKQNEKTCEDEENPDIYSLKDTCHSQSSLLDVEQAGSWKASRVDDCLDKHISTTQEMAKDQMAALAAELEAELELMELNIKTEESHPFEISLYDIDEFSFKGTIKSYYSDRSAQASCEACDVERPSAQSEACCLSYGVSAIELDNRLQELLEAQRRQHILELEERLEDTKARFLLKEHEVFGWKNHVKSLTNLLQFHSDAGGADVHKSEQLDSEEPVSVCDKFVPDIDRNDDSFQSFQGPPDFMQINHVNNDTSADSLAHVCAQKSASLHRSSVSNSSQKSKPSEAPISASMKPRDSMIAARESNCLAGFEESHNVNVKDDVMEGMDMHTAGGNSMFYQDTKCSSNVNLHCKGLSAENTYNHDTDRPRTVAEIPEPFARKYNIGINKSSPCPKEESDHDLNVKYMMNSAKSRPLLLGKYLESSFEEAPQIHEAKKPSVCIDLQSITKEGSQESRERLLRVKSPVLDKIRHYEALGACAREKRA